jgi:hypothetical protein
MTTATAPRTRRLTRARRAAVGDLPPPTPPASGAAHHRLQPRGALPMTTRRVDALPEEHAGPILELLERVRAVATAPDGDGGAWAAAEAGQARVRTGYKAARRTLSAGQYAAHTLRLLALAQPETDREPWTDALAHAGAPIGSWDWDERMQGALDLRRTFKDLPDPLPETVRPVRLVAAWLTHASGTGLVPVTARLAGHVIELEPDDDVLAAAWYATHGDRLLAQLTVNGTPTSGAPDINEAHQRARLRTAVRGIYSAQLHTKVDLAAQAGITRRTLDAWLV